MMYNKNNNSKYIHRNIPQDRLEQFVIDVMENTANVIIETLAEDEDTILTDKQYYKLQGLIHEWKYG